MTERMRDKTRRESVADRYSFGHKALSVVLSVVLLGFGWPAVNPSETFASDESAQADQVQAEVAQPEETQALEETADDSAAMALATADEAAPVAASDKQAVAEPAADESATASAPSAIALTMSAELRIEPPTTMDTLSRIPSSRRRWSTRNLASYSRVIAPSLGRRVVMSMTPLVPRVP